MLTAVEWSADGWQGVAQHGWNYDKAADAASGSDDEAWDNTAATGWRVDPGPTLSSTAASGVRLTWPPFTDPAPSEAGSDTTTFNDLRAWLDTPVEPDPASQPSADAPGPNGWDDDAAEGHAISHRTRGAAAGDPPPREKQ